MPELIVERLSHDGRGITHREGKVAFVAGALPGERVRADLVQRHRRYDEYRLLDVLEAAPERIAPPCPLVGRCGGCDLQHMADPAQVAHKSEVLLDQLRRQAGLVPETLLPPLRADPFAYRRRARLAVGLTRRGGTPVLGLRTAGGTEVVPIDRCPVLVPELMALPGRLQQVLAGLARPGVLGHVELSVAETDAGGGLPVIYLRLVSAPVADDRLALSTFARDCRAYLAIRCGDGPLEYLHRPLPLDPAYLLPDFDLRLAYLPGGFVQGNGPVNRELVAQVVNWVAPAGGTVLDAFCGVGNFTLPLARQGMDVVGLEVSAEAVAVAQANAASNGLSTATFAVQDLLDAPRLSKQPWLPKQSGVAAALLDPPRTGARALIAELASRRIANIVYVSCAPATLARDAAILAGAGYVLKALRLVDMFPQTSHIESVSMFQRTRRGG